jgi:hypothetical protein
MLSSNYDKMCCIKFSAKHDCTNSLRIKYNNTNLLETSNVKFLGIILGKRKLHGVSPRANYTDRATAACRRSDCQLLRIKGAMWSA